MQIEIKELEQCRLSIHYEANAEEILNKRAEVLQHFKKAPVPGFRPGKASIDAIKMHYRNQIEESLKRSLMEDAYHNTLFEKKLKAHGAPRFNSALLADGKFVCEFDLHTKPEIDLSPYLNLEIPKPHETETASELTEKLLQELRVRFGEANPYTDGEFIQSGDNVILDYEGSVDGVLVDNLTAQGEMLTVGRSQLTQFDDNLLGMSLGEIREFDLIVPENGLPSLAGKTVHFKVTLNMGSKTIPCPLDDTLAVKVGKSSYEELRGFVHASAQGRVTNQAKNSLIETIANRLIETNIFTVPNWMALSEAQYLAHNSKLDWNTIQDIDKEKYLEMGSKNVKLSLILDKIREVEPEAQMTDNEVFDMIKANILNSQVQTSPDEVIKEMNRTGYLQILMSRIRDEYTLDFIVKSAKIIE